MITDKNDEKEFAKFQAALDARDCEREKAAVADWYKRRAQATLRDLCLTDFHSY